MNVLIADDDLISRNMLKFLLSKWGYQSICVGDGNAAFEILKESNSPRLIILDWVMPGMEGAEVCRRFRKLSGSELSYIILLTSKDHKEDIVKGLNAGANDYIIKPFDREELRARLNVGRQMVELQSALSNRVKALEEASSHIKKLQGILPICSYCRRIRDDKNYWQQLEQYFTEYADVQFSHSICPKCYEKYVKPEIESIKQESNSD